MIKSIVYFIIEIKKIINNRFVVEIKFIIIKTNIII